MTDLATLQARLTEAEAAYHRLLTGSLEESVASGTRRVAYMLADAPKLLAYISALNSQIAALSGTAGRRRALTVTL